MTPFLNCLLCYALASSRMLAGSMDLMAGLLIMLMAESESRNVLGSINLWFRGHALGSDQPGSD